MRNSTTILPTTVLATIALGAVLVTGSATASFAGGGGGDGAIFIRGHGGFGGGRSFGGHPFTMRHGNFGMHRGFEMRHSFNGDHRFYGRRHFGHFHGGDDLDDFFGFVPFFGPGQYGAYCGDYRSYDPASGTYLGRSGYRYYCP
jgi:BA14K-like protein